MGWFLTNNSVPGCNSRNTVRAAGLALMLIPLAPLWPQTPAALPATEVEAVVTTDLGVFRFEFAPDKAPRHVEAFIARARQGYYDGSAFFRVVSYGIIQGGDPLLKDPKTPRNLWGTGGLNLLKDEFSDLKHERGVVSTVRIPGKADSDGAQFFVCISPQPQLNGQFSAFGRVTEGMDVVEKISQTPAGPDNVTHTPVRILKVAIEKKKVEPFINATPDEMRKTVTLKTTLGMIKVKMEPDWAPNTVRNFLMLTATGWYNGTAFHRLIKGFVVQGGMGDTRVGGAAHPADRWVHTIKGEFRPDVKHTRGIISMARGDDPDSADTSFFLMLGDAPHLDGKYAAFGRVVAGMEVLDAFEKEEVDGEKPKRRLELIEATID
ncbi:MAG TPA: peptidylprolyl isomerase [Bryobacteraceae bacterium]|nr:peptidylprolyl isomerase [Bryobacteraceae bacterium]